MNSLRLAVSFLTILPAAPRDAAHMGAARAYFPLVGLVLGGILAGLDFAARLALPAPVVGALLVVALLVLTRAIHTEGFLDCCDGLFGGYSPARRLEILRDTRVGAFAVAGGVGLLLLKWALFTEVPGEVRVSLLTIFPCLSRFGMLLTMAAFPYAREQGMGTAFRADTGRWHIVLGLVTAAAAGGLLLGATGIFLLGAAIAAALALAWWISRMLGGMTGDAYGAVNEIVEVAALLAGLILVQTLPETYWTLPW